MKSSNTNREYPIQVICATQDTPDLSSGCSCCHREVEILFVHSGQILLETDNISVTLKPGQGIFINQNVPHTVFADEKGTFQLYCLLFDPSFLLDKKQADLTDRYLSPILANPDIRILLLGDASDSDCSILSLARDIVACNLTGAFGCELYTRGRLCLLWYQILLRLLRMEETGKTDDARNLPCATVDGIRIRQAVRFIEKNCTESLTLDDVAFSIRVSRSECCRCFKRTLSLTPVEYIQKYRIYLSTRKLHAISDTPLAIAELATAVGFHNASYYNKLFRKYLNCTPTQYRQNPSEDSAFSEETPASAQNFPPPLL